MTFRVSNGFDLGTTVCKVHQQLMQGMSYIFEVFQFKHLNTSQYFICMCTRFLAAKECSGEHYSKPKLSQSVCVEFTRRGCFESDI